MMEEIQVAVPALPDYIHVVRAVAGAVAAGLSLSYDEIDDIRIAVDEACSHLLDIRPRGGSLRLSIRAQDGALRLVVSVDTPSAAWPPADARQTLTWQVLSALAEDAEFSRTETGPGIRFSKRLPA